MALPVVLAATQSSTVRKHITHSSLHLCLYLSLLQMRTFARFAQSIDDFLGLFGLHPELMSRLDAVIELRAIYVLTNYIDAHTFAQEHLHLVLGR